MNAEFQISSPGHVLKRIMERYRKTEAEAEAILQRVKSFLETSTPADWRFTESPSSRFFILDEETQAKFMGLSYRDSETGQGIIDFIQANIEDSQRISARMGDLVKQYIGDVYNPGLPIVHDIRTVYARGEREGTIGEEKTLLNQARLALSHTLPITSHRIAARPNAIIGIKSGGRDEALWVRQYLNWISMDPNSKEYYLFQVLTRDGLDKCRFAIFSYTANGDLRLVGEPNTLRCAGYRQALDEAKAPLPAGPGATAVRSESYWKVPTCVDRRYIDLAFKQRYSKRGPKNGEQPEPESFLTPAEALELCFLGEIVERARAKLHK